MKSTMVFMFMLGFSVATLIWGAYVDHRQETQLHVYSVTCNGIYVEYESPWELPPEDVCSSFEQDNRVEI